LPPESPRASWPGIFSWAQVLMAAALAGPPSLWHTAQRARVVIQSRARVHRDLSAAASPLGTKRDHAGISQSEMCWRVLAALYAAAPLPRGGRSRRGCHRGRGGIG
jgi:hypothetical protein